MKKYISLILLPSLFLSCSSNFKLEIPGKTETEISNIYLEYNNIADIYFSMEKYDKAVFYYNKALNYDEIYWSVYYKQAKTYVCMKDWKKAEEMFKTLLERDPQNSTLKSSLAYISAMKGNFAESENIYSELIEKYPEEQSYLVNYISILITDKKNPEAISKLSLLKERFPDNKNIESFEKELKIEN